jgi:hypothetical protein
MTLSPSNQSTSDDSSKLNHKGVATERYALLKLHFPKLIPDLFVLSIALHADVY